MKAIIPAPGTSAGKANPIAGGTPKPTSTPQRKQVMEDIIENLTFRGVDRMAVDLRFNRETARVSPPLHIERTSRIGTRLTLEKPTEELSGLARESFLQAPGAVQIYLEVNPAGTVSTGATL